MDTLLIQVTNKKARGLINELEELHLIKVLKENLQPKQKLSGKLPTDIADESQGAVTENRYEWWKDKEFVAELDRTHKAMESGAEKGVTLEEFKISIEAIRLGMYGK